MSDTTFRYMIIFNNAKVTKNKENGKKLFEVCVELVETIAFHEDSKIRRVTDEIETRRMSVLMYSEGNSSHGCKCVMGDSSLILDHLREDNTDNFTPLDRMLFDVFRFYKSAFMRDDRCYFNLSISSDDHVRMENSLFASLDRRARKEQMIP